MYVWYKKFNLKVKQFSSALILISSEITLQTRNSMILWHSVCDKRPQDPPDVIGPHKISYLQPKYPTNYYKIGIFLKMCPYLVLG